MVSNICLHGNKVARCHSFEGSRTGLPMKLLTDRGSQIVVRVVKSLYEQLSIDKLQTIAYHPQTKGMLERLQGTLEAMLAKAAEQDLNWVQ